MRYLKQRDTFRCAAIAVINALKWRGLKVTGADAMALSKKWGLSKEAPASCSMVQKALETKGQTLNEQQVFEAMQAGHAVVVNTWYTVQGDLRGHVWFCPGLVEFHNEAVGYLGINVYHGHKRSLLTRAEMAELLHLGLVWVLKR